MMKAAGRFPLHPLNKMEWTVPEGPSLEARHRGSDGAHRRYECSEEPVPEDWVLVWPPRGQRLFGVKTGSSQKPNRRLLLTFAALAEARPSKVRTFAQRYGPLGLCEHGTPCTHRESGAVFGLDAAEIDDQDCDPLPEERILDWQRFARQANSMLDIVIELDQRNLASRDLWEPLRVLTPPVDLTKRLATTDREARQRWPSALPDQDQRKALNEQRAVLSAYISEWLLMAGIRPRFDWSPSRRGVDLVGRGSLFAAVALQLADIASGGVLIARCDECHCLFTPTRRPSPKREVFCKAKCKEARKKRYHRRKAEGL